MPDRSGDDSPRSVRRGLRGRREQFEERAAATREEIRAQVAATRAQLDASNERLAAKTGRNLPAAIALGLVLGGSMVVSLVLVKAFFMVIAAAIVTFTVLELASALRFAGRDIPRIPTVVLSLAMVPVAFYLGGAGMWGFFLLVVVLLGLWRTVEILLTRSEISRRDYWLDLGAGTFVLAYVPFLGTFSVLLTAQEGGQWWTLVFIVLVIATDTGAYISGLNFGRHPMAPRISPKKTWEGFVGSLIFALVAGVLSSILLLDMPAWFGVLMGLTIAGTATLGDLTESLIKRDLGIKDISTWLPGHGGFLDRVDSILPSAAAAYCLYVVFA